MEEMPKNTGARIIKQLLAYKGVSIKEVADGLGYNSAQVLSNKLYRDTLPLNEFVRIVNFLGCEVKTVSKDGKNEYVIEYKGEEAEEVQ
ncbi:hypothetical protein IKJ53_01220 [bacterium]|nr:hypothetical protein [bacterium]